MMARRSCVLTFLLTVLFNINEILSLSPNRPAYYELWGVTSYNGSFLTTNDTSICHSSTYSVVCDAVSSNNKLTDGVTGPETNLLTGSDLGLFFAFGRHSGTTYGNRILSGFINDTSAVRIYFYNSPQNFIGLPNITVIESLRKPIVPYVFSDNKDLSQNDSQARHVTLYFDRAIRSAQLEITFTSDSKIDWFLVSEIKYLQGPITSPPVNPVVFKNDGMSVVTLGQSDNLQSSINLSCTVVNDGSFEWEWFYNNQPLPNMQRFQVWIGDATRTTTLNINQLSYTDDGNYTCVVNHQRNKDVRDHKSFKVQLKALLTTNTSIIDCTSITVGTPILLSCEMQGYLRPQIIWTKNGRLQNSTNIINGSSASISTNSTPTTSVINILAITFNIPQGNTTYVCEVPGTNLKRKITLVRRNSTGSVVVSTRNFKNSTMIVSASKSSTLKMTSKSIAFTIISNTILSSDSFFSFSSLPTSAPINNDTPAIVVPFVVSVSVVSFVLLLSSCLIFSIAAFYTCRRPSNEMVSPVKDHPTTAIVPTSRDRSIDMYNNSAYTTVIDYEEAIYAEVADLSDQDYI